MKTVLIVEDIPVAHLIMSSVLKAYAQVLVAENLSAARNIIQDRAQKLDAIILDFNLPTNDWEHLMGQSAELMPLIHDLRSDIPVFAASLEAANNETLASLGCIQTSKETAAETCRKYLLHGQ